jgi:hypothetical protein
MVLRNILIYISFFVALAATGPAMAESSQMDCGSLPDGIRTYCPLPDDINRVTISQRYSHMPCVFGESWGLEDTSLWTSKGCSALFTIHFGEEPIVDPATTIDSPQSLDDTDLPYGYINGRFQREA